MSRCHNPKLLESEDISEMLCKLLKLHAVPEVGKEPFNENTLNYHYFMAFFKEVVESKIDDPRGRLTRLIKYTTGDAQELIKHCIQLPSNEGFKNATYLLEKVYGNPHKILVSYRRKAKLWPQMQFGDSKGFRKLHNFLLNCRSVSASQMECIRHTRYALYNGIQATRRNSNGKMEQINSQNQEKSTSRTSFKEYH